LFFIQQDLYEDVNYGVLTPLTKIKVKVNPSGEYIFRHKYHHIFLWIV